MGDKVTSSLAGGLTINEGSGEIVIRDSTKEVVRIDKTGFQYFDTNGVRRFSMGKNPSGQQQFVVYGSDGKSQILIGQDPKDGTPIIAVSDDGKDVITELQNG